jgi:hypothetical protein
VPPVPVLTTVPGDITVLTPQGDIIASVGGILQQSFDVNAADSGAQVTLQAGTPGASGFGSTDPALYIGNIDAEPAGVIGINIKLQATGDIKGLIIGKNNVNVVGNLGPGLILGKTVDVPATSSGGEPPTIIGTKDVTGGGAGNLSPATMAPVTATAASQSAAQQSSSDVAQTVASNKLDDEDDKKKNKKTQPLLKHIKRVTVILPQAT